ncbi:hypothetical protein [Candidatus Chlorohelix sp.]|uniref:hypothetical protein n=1 Tax=Candidatus Chlorohelix sp. TaxID=3139201 RepID=UPI003028416C
MSLDKFDENLPSEWHSVSDELVIEAESVTSFRSHQTVRIGRRILGVLFRIVIAGVVAYILLLLPDSISLPFYSWKNPLVVFVTIVFIGKTLLDTFYYDHYPS